MPYAIMRSKKLQTLGGVAAALQHNFRERDTPNADPSKTDDNMQWREPGTISTDQAMGKLRELLPVKRRKDAVLVVEYLMTASPEWFAKATPEQQSDFFTRSMHWLIDKYGAANVIAATVQVDEKTPHLSAFVVPKTQDGRLSAKEFIGNRQLMRHDQTTFAEKVRDLGLERGIEGSKARHQRVQQHYGQINKADATNQMLLPEFLLQPQHPAERPVDIAARISMNFHKHFASIIEKASVSAQNARRAKEMEKTARDKHEAGKELAGRLKKAESILNPLSELQKLDTGFFSNLMRSALAKLNSLKNQQPTHRSDKKIKGHSI